MVSLGVKGFIHRVFVGEDLAFYFFFRGIMGLEPSGRPVPLVKDYIVIVIELDLSQLMFRLNRLHFLRQKIIASALISYERLGQTVLLHDLIDSFPAPIDEDFIVNLKILPDLYVEFYAVAIELFIDMYIVIDAELITAYKFFLVSFEYFSKFDLQIGRKAEILLGQTASDALPLQDDLTLLVGYAEDGVSLANNAIILYRVMSTVKKVYLVMGEEIQSLGDFVQQSDAGELKTEVVLFLHSI
jgi:hypothetical protein